MIENLMMYTCAKHCHKRWSSDKAIAKIKRCSFFASQCSTTTIEESGMDVGWCSLYCGNVHVLSYSWRLLMQLFLSVMGGIKYQLDSIDYSIKALHDWI